MHQRVAPTFQNGTKKGIPTMQRKEVRIKWEKL